MKTLKDDLWLEIRDQEHLMLFGGSSNRKLTKEEVEKAVFDRGYIATNVTVEFDEMQKLWRTSGDIQFLASS